MKCVYTTSWTHVREVSHQQHSL